MLFVYINNAVPDFTIHQDAGCKLIQMQHRPGQRYLHVTPASLGNQLQPFAAGQVRFAAEDGWNELWLEIALDTPEQEVGLVHILQALLSQRYKRMASAAVNIHC